MHSFSFSNNIGSDQYFSNCNLIISRIFQTDFFFFFPRLKQCVLTKKFSNCILFTSVADKFFIYSFYVYFSTFRKNSVKNKNMHLPNNRPQIISNSRLNRQIIFSLFNIYVYTYIYFFPTFAANSHLLTNKSKIVTYSRLFTRQIFKIICSSYSIRFSNNILSTSDSDKYIYIYIYFYFYLHVFSKFASTDKPI